MPHDADTTRCASCGSTLLLVQGVLTHLLRERPGLDRDQAAAMLRAWLGREGYAPASVNWVGELAYFPFLRITRSTDEIVVPLADLPSPAVGFLAQAPSELLDSDRAMEGIDQAELEAALGDALADPDTRSLQIEERGYFPARFNLGDKTPVRCSAIVDAGQGTVYPDALPSRSGRSGTFGDPYLLGLAAILVAEAVAIPGIWPRLVAIVVTAAIAAAVTLKRGGSLG